MAKHLLLDRLPRNITADKDGKPAGHMVVGEMINDSGLIEALLEYGSYDRYFYLSSSPAKSGDPGSFSHERLARVDFTDIDQLRELEHLVLFTSSLALAKFVPLRRFYSRLEWPICGVTHCLYLVEQLSQCVSLLMAALEPYDAVICTNEGARITLDNIVKGISQSASVRSGSLQKPRLMTPVIPLGVSLPRNAALSRRVAREQLGLPMNAIIYLSIGRFSEANKVDLKPLICSFLLDDELPQPSVLMLAGDDVRWNLAPELSALASEIDSPHKVVLMPNITSSIKNSLLAAADIFVALSDTFEETFGISVVEAMLSGLPVIASDWDGYRHLITDQLEGLLIPSYFHEDTTMMSALTPLFRMMPLLQAQRVCIDLPALRNAMRVMGNNSEMRLRLGEAAKKKANQQFTWRTVVHQYERLWEEQIDLARELVATTSLPDDPLQAPYYDYRKAFGRYPTRFLSDDCQVSITTYRAKLNELVPSKPWLNKPAIGFLEGGDSKLLEILMENGTTTLRDLIHQCVSHEMNRFTIISHVSRLMKYGVLEANFSDYSKGEWSNVNDY